MSTIKVNRIENTSTTDGGVSIDVDGHVTIDGQQLPTAGALSNRNLIINGAMEVAQRSSAELNAVQSTGGLKYQTLDRWGYWSNNNNLFSSNQVEDAPPGFYHSVQLKSLGNNNMGSGGYNTWSQRIEAQNLYHTGIGTANAKDLILSFWVKASTAGTYSFYCFNSPFTYCFTSTYTVQADDTWEYKTITIPGPTSNFSETGNSRQIEIGFTLGAGTTYSTSTLNQWQAGNYLIGATGAINLVETIDETLNITGVQLEVGSKATPFEHRSFHDEQLRCMRYCQKFGETFTTLDGNAVSSDDGFVTLANYVASTAYGGQKFIVPMRTRPTLAAAGCAYYSGGTTDSSVDVALVGASTTYGELRVSGFSMTQGNAGWLRIEAAGAYIEFNAEL